MVLYLRINCYFITSSPKIKFIQYCKPARRLPGTRSGLPAYLNPIQDLRIQFSFGKHSVRLYNLPFPEKFLFLPARVVNDR